ncbi:MAG: hypothetical protein LC792_09395 [Actinobacteria bacterium]|nr:hypothetical protein [Actinomycetota bacterium]
MMKRLGSVLGMGLAALALILPGLVFDGAGAAPGGGAVSGLQETTVRYGPFVLPPAGKGGDMDHANVVMPDVAKPCEDCFITRAEPDLVYEDGTPANLDTGLMLHHAVLFNTGRPDTTCGKDTFFGRMGERFMASGNERTVKRMPDGYGYHLGQEPVNGVFHIMNHSDETKTVFVSFKVNWLPGSTPGVRPVTPVWLDVNNCRTSEYAVPAGPSSTHWTWPSTITGRIVSTGGHVHTGGVRTTLSNQTTGQRICTSWAVSNRSTTRRSPSPEQWGSWCCWSGRPTTSPRVRPLRRRPTEPWRRRRPPTSRQPALRTTAVTSTSTRRRHALRGRTGRKLLPARRTLHRSPPPAMTPGALSPREEWVGASRFHRFSADGSAFVQSRRCRAHVRRAPGAGIVRRVDRR